VFSLSGDDLTTRLDARESGKSSRGDVYALVVRAIGDAPLLGTGYGSFPDVFPIYRDDSIRGTNTWRRAHNTYLENTLELGIPAAIALFAAIGTCAGYCWLGILRRRRNWVFPSIGVATTALVAAHSSIDFSLQIPAISIGYAFLLGLACAQSFPTRHV
jgi:O-antigen ligase